MIALGITVKDTATPALQSLIEGMKPSQLNPIVGRSARNVVREYLFAYNGSHGNRLGGSRTNYYTGAARGTQFQVAGDQVVVSINQVGFAQRYYGGTIKPVAKKFLTIPARAEAHGKRASEFPDLIVLFGRNGPYALARAGSTKIGFGHADASGHRGVISRGEQGGEIMFWLVKSVTQQPNPDVIPTESAISKQVNQDVGAYVQRLWQRQSGNSGDNGGAN